MSPCSGIHAAASHVLRRGRTPCLTLARCTVTIGLGPALFLCAACCFGGLPADCMWACGATVTVNSESMCCAISCTFQIARVLRARAPRRVMAMAYGIYGMARERAGLSTLTATEHWGASGCRASIGHALRASARARGCRVSCACACVCVFASATVYTLALSTLQDVLL